MRHEKKYGIRHAARGKGPSVSPNSTPRTAYRAPQTANQYILTGKYFSDPMIESL